MPVLCCWKSPNRIQIGETDQRSWGRCQPEVGESGRGVQRSPVAGISARCCTWFCNKQARAAVQAPARRAYRLECQRSWRFDTSEKLPNRFLWRQRQYDAGWNGIVNLKDKVDNLTGNCSNDRLLQVLIVVPDAWGFRIADDVPRRVQGISDLIGVPGLINDFADVKPSASDGGLL